MLRKEATEAEDLLWQQLRGRRCGGLKFRRQHPIDRYVVDFFCLEKKLIVEVDGGIHLDKEVRENDHRREVELMAFGYKMVRVTNDEVRNEMEKVLEFIENM